MAKKIAPTREGGKEFRISIDEQKIGKFPGQREVVVVLSDTGVSELDVYQKDFPDFLQNVQYDNMTVSWLNIFGMKKKNETDYANLVPRYTVIIDKIPGAKGYVIYDGSMTAFDPTKLRYLDTTDRNATQAEVPLDLGDPAIGWVK